MKNATRMVISSMGVLMALSGFEHGLGEALQGNNPTGGMFIRSWPDSDFLRVLAGEPALTLIPNLLISGIVTMAVSLAILVWVTLFIHQRRGALVLVGLSVVLLLVGGGFGPPLLGFVLSAGASQINAPFSDENGQAPGGVQNFLGRAWLWVWAVCLILWLSLLVGIPILSMLLSLDSAEVVFPVVLCAFAFIGLAIFSARAHDGGYRHA
jgi:hypothetical protein